jgi:hypothetical protein
MAFEPSQLIPALLKDHSRSNETQIQGVRKGFQDYRNAERDQERADREQKRKEAQLTINERQVGVMEQAESRQQRAQDLEVEQQEAFNKAIEESQAKFAPTSEETAFAAMGDPQADVSQLMEQKALTTDPAEQALYQEVADGINRDAVSTQQQVGGPTPNLNREINRWREIAQTKYINKEQRQMAIDMIKVNQQLQASDRRTQLDWQTHVNSMKGVMYGHALSNPSEYARLRKQMIARSPLAAHQYPENPADYVDAARAVREEEDKLHAVLGVEYNPVKGTWEHMYITQNKNVVVVDGPAPDAIDINEARQSAIADLGFSTVEQYNAVSTQAMRADVSWYEAEWTSLDKWGGTLTQLEKMGQLTDKQQSLFETKREKFHKEWQRRVAKWEKAKRAEGVSKAASEEERHMAGPDPAMVTAQQKKRAATRRPMPTQEQVAPNPFQIEPKHSSEEKNHVSTRVSMAAEKMRQFYSKWFSPELTNEIINDSVALLEEWHTLTPADKAERVEELRVGYRLDKSQMTEEVFDMLYNKYRNMQFTPLRRPAKLPDTFGEGF